MQLPIQFGPYILLERVSVGGMAEVYKAKEYGVEGFERTVAVKRILPHIAEDDEFIAMFKDEAMIAVQLNHGNIAQIYNLGNEQDSFYIALEYVNGRDLRAIFQKCQQQARAMPTAQACYVIMKICEGLDYAHNKKDKFQRDLHIVHRDVSPPNIIVSFEGEVKLIDFGVAKAAGRASRTQAGILKGKFGYMSPEQVRGMPLDRRSDVFSVGVVLFEMLTGHRLFQADTDYATLEKVRAVDVPRPSSLNPEIGKPLENIIYKALTREPEERYQSSIELHDELQAFMFAQGLFYSRKDLVAWMRTQYAREIELEKERDKLQASIRPDNMPGSPSPPRRRQTMMMGPRATPPPAPVAAAPPAATPPPPPPQRAAEAGAERASGPRSQKRKTMVMTTARPNLPPPPSGGGARFRRDPEGEPPTVPLAQAVARPQAAAPQAAAPRAAPATPGPPSKPPSTMSYASAALPPTTDFDWDDDELETRLFEGEESITAGFTGGGQRNGAPRSALPNFDSAPTLAPPPKAGPGPSARAPTALAGSGATSQPPVTAPAPGSAGNGMGAVMQYGAPVPLVNTAVPAAAPSYAAVPGAVRTNPIGGDGPYPMSHPQSAPAAAHAGYSHVGSPSPAQELRRPPQKMSVGSIIGIVVAFLMIAGVVTVTVMMLRGDVTLPDAIPSSQSAAEATPADAAAEPSAPVPAPGAATPDPVAVPDAPADAEQVALTVRTTPADSEVRVDGIEVAGPSPFVVPRLKPGTHTLAVEHEGFVSFGEKIEVPEGGVEMPIELQARDVTLVLRSEPEAAELTLFVNGEPVAMDVDDGEYKLVRADATKYEIEGAMEGFVTRRDPLEFTGETTQIVGVTLARDPVAMAAAEAKEAAASKRSTKRSTKRTSKSSGSDEPDDPAPTKTSAKSSTLRIGTNSGVPPAEVYVDKKFAGKTPITSYPVTPGRHTVLFKWGDLNKEVSRTVSVDSGASKVVKAGPA